MNQRGLAPVIHLIIGAVIGIVAISILIGLNRSNQSSSPVSQPSISPSPTTQGFTSLAQFDETKLSKFLTVEAALLGVSDNFSLYFKDLNSEKTVTLDPTRSWIPASTIKAYVVLEAFRQRDLGLINFDQTITIVADNVVPTELETDEFPRLREGSQTTFRQLLEAMVIQSDNTAYNSLLDVLDRRNINNSLRNIGLTETVVGEKLNLDDSQSSKDFTVPGRQNNTTTAKDLATFFDLLYNKKVPDSEEMLAIFKRQKINSMIPALLPINTVVAHKTGDWAPIFHDGGVVYKTDAPFVLAIYTNSNNPSALAQLAKVAYYQDSQSVGRDLTTNVVKRTTINPFLPTIALAPETNLQVLAEETTQKLPKVTAEDLGITTNDLSLVDLQDARKISGALITPKSLFYPIKRFFETVRNSVPFLAPPKIDQALSQSNSRLSELKSVLKNGDLETSRRLLEESETNLKDAVNEAKKSASPDTDLTNIKQINDLHYATLAEVAKQIDPSSKEKFVDAVYNYLQENKKEVKPTIAKSIIANPLQQKPLIGTIKNVNGNQATVQFDDGTEKSLTLNNFTPVRDFHSDQLDTSNNLTEGSKVAIVGKSTTDKIIPQFILKNIPRELPDKHEGIVLEIDPKDRILKIKEKDQVDTIEVSQNTIVKGSDTSVSIEGIKAGSKITVFGEYQATPSATLTPSASPTSLASNLPLPKPSGTVGPAAKPGQTIKPGQTTKPGTTSAPPSGPSRNQGSQKTIKATTISVTKNSSGKQESQPKQQSQPKSSTKK